MVKKKLLFLLLGIISAIFLSIFFSLSTLGQTTTTLCSYAGPDLSDDLMRLTNFSVAGHSNLKEGDTITVKFNLENYGQYDRQLGSKGIFAAARDPSNLDTSFGFSYSNTTLEYGGSRTIEVVRILDKAGTWKIWPSYHLSLATGEKLGPDNWHACSLTVGAKIVDSDGDGISDQQDNCPQNYNPNQEDVDKDGAGDTCDACDDRDFDGDGIKNCLDKCPNESETFNQYQDDDGCPDEVPKPKDTTSPTVTISHAPSEVDTTTNVTFTAIAQDNASVSKIVIYIDGSQTKECLPPDFAEGNWRCVHTGGPFPAGTLTYKAEAFDPDGNMGTSSEGRIEVKTITFKMPPPEAAEVQALYEVSGEIESFVYDYSRLKIGVCRAEKKCFFSFGKIGLFCQEICSSDGFIKYADVSREGERLNYSVKLPSGSYILEPIFQPIGDCRWQSWNPKEQFVVVKDSNVEGVNFRHLPLGAQNPKVDVLILGSHYKSGKTGWFYTNEERKRLEDNVQKYQFALADEGLCSYFGYLDSDDIGGIAGTDFWNCPSCMQGIIRQMVSRLNSSYLLLVGGNSVFWGTSTDDFYGDLNGDNLLDIPVGRIPDPDNGDIEVLINYFDTATQLHKNGGLDLSNYQGLMMDGSWTASRCLYKELFGRECSMDRKCKNSLFDCTLAEANNKGFFLLLLHGSDYPQKFSTNYDSEGGIYKCLGWGEGKGFLSADVSSLNIRNSLWLALPCYGGLIENRAASQESVPIMFLKNRGAAYIGDNDLSYGSHGCPKGAMNCRGCLDSSCNTCSEELPAGDSCSGALYLEVAKRFSPGTRIGDAFLQGKNNYYANYDCVWEGRDYIYHIAHLYGDPTLKIKRKW